MVDNDNGRTSAGTPEIIEETGRRFGFMSLLADILRLMGRRPSLVGAAAFAGALPSMAVGLAMAGTFETAGALLPVYSLVSIVVWIAGHAVAVAIVAQALAREAAGEAAGLAEVVSTAFARALPAIATSAIVASLTVLGLIAFVLPGILLMLRWWVAVPVAAIEGAWPMRSLARSASLTAGHRLPILGILLLLWLLFAGLIHALVAMSDGLDRPLPLPALCMLQFLWTGLTATAAACAYRVLAATPGRTAA